MKRNKLYVKPEGKRESKLCFIFCEGEKREPTYFHFFNRIASQIIIQLVPIIDGKNSPMGLYNNACQRLIKNDNNPNPSYVLEENDEVYFVIDTDKWGDQINVLRGSVSNHQNWLVVQSNPSFEVWLYYHFLNQRPAQMVVSWKQFLDKVVPGGFDSKKHPVYIERAIINAETNFVATNELPDPSCTEVFKLAKKILPLVKADIDALLKKSF